MKKANEGIDIDNESQPSNEPINRSRSMSFAEADAAYSDLKLGAERKRIVDPIDIYDPHHKVAGKKPFDPHYARQMRTTIMLKFPD